MKKSLVLAMAMALGVTASAYAANPFSDVPAGHWAYDSINKLAAAGIVNGYEDGTFKGQKLMTRYEMAKIVATAMAKGANVDRLASEFADELDSLGVRVANLEKKSDNVKVTGQIRYHYANDEAKAAEDGSKISTYSHKLRSRISVNGQVNDDWKYVGMLQNQQDFTNNEEDTLTEFQRAYLEGKLGGLKATAGRFNNTLVDGNLYDTRFDGVKVAYGDKVKLGAYYGKPTDTKNVGVNLAAKTDGAKFGKAWGVNAGTQMGGFGLTAGYDKFSNGEGVDYNNNAVTDASNGVWNVGAIYDFGNASLGAIYMKSNLDEAYLAKDASTKGFVVTGTVGAAKAAKVGSVGFQAKYYNQGAGTFLAHTMNGAYSDFLSEGFKGYSAAVDYTVAKNMILGVQYYDLKGKETENKNKTLWGQMMVTF